MLNARAVEFVLQARLGRQWRGEGTLGGNLGWGQVCAV